MSEILIWSDRQILAVLASKLGLIMYPGGLPSLATARAIRAGDVLAKNTGDDSVIVCKSTQLAVATEATDVLITVDDAHPFELGDTIDVGSESGKVITSINYTTNVIGFADDIAGVEAIDVRVHSPSDSQNDPMGIALFPLEDSRAGRVAGGVDLVTPPVTSMYGNIAIAGTFKYSALLNFHSDVDTGLGGQENVENDIYIITTPPNVSLT